MKRRMSDRPGMRKEGLATLVLLSGILIIHTGVIVADNSAQGNESLLSLKSDQLLIQTEQHARLRRKISHPQDLESISSGSVTEEILVKFDAQTAERVDQRIEKGRSRKSRSKISEPFDTWSQQYNVSEIRRILKGSAGDGRAVLQRLQKTAPQKLNSKENKILTRLKRVRGNPVIPQPDRTYRINLEIGEGQTLAAAVEELSCQSGVECAQINHVYQLHGPNDPLYPLQWALENTGQIYPPGYAGTPGSDIHAQAAWTVHTGDPSVVVAVIDSGLDLAHRDLQENLWTNPDEIPSNGIDDDGNGYVDDVFGYDFSDEDADPSDYMGHGTHCAGIIAACGNNGLDISGVAWQAQIMALKMFPLATDEAAFASMIYAADNGADVISCSWGPGGRSPANPLLEEAIEYAHSMGCIVVFSAGNENDDVAYYSPANHPKTLAVSATDSQDRKASFSNYGDRIDIAAPGVDILSLRAQGTTLGAVYDEFTVVASGTSMACPQVSGACALLLSIDETAGLEEVREILQRTGTVIADSPRIGLRLDTGAMAQVAAGKGILYLDRQIYSCSDTVILSVLDRDAAGAAGVEVILDTDGGDQERVFLMPSGLGSSLFRGSINTTDTGVNISDGWLQISHGQMIHVSYLDAGEGVWISAVAEADCKGPVINSVDIYAPGPRVVITVKADEPFHGRVRLGQQCGGPYSIEQTQTDLLDGQEFIVRGFQPGQTYYLLVECTDSVGNITLEDQAGSCYAFTTTTPWGQIKVPLEFLTIQEAMDRAWEGDEVIVADGTYSGPGNYNLNFYGENITVRSESGPLECIIDCRAKGRGFVFIHGEDNRSIVDGFTIRNGWAQVDYDPDYQWSNELGGGIYCLNSYPTIRNCRLVENYSETYGGGLYFESVYGGIVLENCQFFANQSGWGGGAVCVGDAILENCIFRSNSSVNLYAEGGGLIATGHVDLRRCFFLNNQAMNYPGFGSAGYSYGGGIYLADGSGHIEQCLFQENQSTYGGGVAVYASQIDLVNTLVCENKAGVSGGGIWAWNSQANLLHCTVAENEANSTLRDVGGGGIKLLAGRTRIENSIIWDNQAGGFYGQDIQVSGWCTRYQDKRPYRCIQDVRAELSIGHSALKFGMRYLDRNRYTDLIRGEGILGDNLRFLWADNYHLSGFSPCVNAAVNTPCMDLPDFDFEGNSRWIGPAPDMGAFEYNSLHPVIGLSKETLYFRSMAGDLGGEVQNVWITNSGKKSPMNWEIISQEDWIRIESGSGRWPKDQCMKIRIDPSKLTAGNYDAILQVESPEAINTGRFLFIRAHISGDFSVPEKYPTIQSAVLAAHSGERILVEEGVYTGPGNRDIRCYGKAITIKSRKGPQTCILDCQGTMEDPHRGFRLYELKDAEDPVIEGFTIQNGVAGESYLKQLPAREGAGIYIYGIKPIIRNCIFRNNRAAESGGAIFSIMGDREEHYLRPVSIEDCIFSNNNADLQGGGVSLIDRVIVQNSLFFDNKAFQGGGGYCMGSIQSLVNCTITRNEAVRGGGICLDDSIEEFSFKDENTRMNLVNSIVWNNFALTGPEILLGRSYPDTLPPASMVGYSDIKGGKEGIIIETEGQVFWGNGNINENPAFLGPGIGDFHLIPGSSCIDAADGDHALEYDLEGKQRYDDPDTVNKGIGLINYVDMGALEYTKK